MSSEVLKLKNGLVLSEYKVQEERIIHDYYDGFARVEYYGKYNFIDYDGVILSEQWFDSAWNFYGGFAKIYLNEKWNFINKKGEYLSEQWFDWVYIFCNGLTNVKLNGKYNVLKFGSEPVYIFDDWYATIYELNDIGFLLLKDGKWNIGDFNGKILSDIWSEERILTEKDFYKVKVNGKYNYLDENFKLFSEEWFDYIFYDEGYILVKRGRKYNYLKLNGELVSKKWFDHIDYEPQKGVFGVKNNKKYNYIDESGVLVFSEWSDDCIYLCNNIGILNVKGRWNLYKQEDSSKILDESFDEIKHLKGLYYSVKLNDKWNIIKVGDGYMSDEWFDDMYKACGEYIFVVKGDKRYTLPRYLLGD